MMIWPHKKRIAAILTFNFDAESLWLAMNPKNATSFSALSRGSYGPKRGLPRILETLDSLDVKGTFFTPGWVVERYPEQVKEISDRGHEIAYHGYLPKGFLDGSYEQEEAELVKCETLIQDVCGQKPVGYRAPGGIMHSFTVDLIKKRNYIYSSSLMDCDYAYFHQTGGQRTTVAELPTDPIYDDRSYYFFSLNEPVHRGITSAAYMVDIWKDEFDGLAAEGNKIITLVMHPQLSGRSGRIRALSDFISYMKLRGAWIARCDEVARHLISGATCFPKPTEK